MKLSNHFSRREFLDDGRNLTPIQSGMLVDLCENILEPIREFLKCSISVSDGVRFPHDINRLRKAGYNPSETSDHLLGNVIRIRSQNKKNKWGEYYSFSMGAADIVPKIGAKEAFEMMEPYFNKTDETIELPNRTIKVGQFILEKNRTYWLHVSNPATLIYSSEFAQRHLKKRVFLKSLDNGKSYTEI